MLELGRWSEDLHREVGRYAARSGVTVLVGIRGAARQLVDAGLDAGLSPGAALFFDEPGEAGRWVKEQAREGDALLFKGSRGTKVELALEAFLN
jgi:UDP-N-acetylmuramoyl-tripeptide--D-alanyl-D-alanine ligase